MSSNPRDSQGTAEKIDGEAALLGFFHISKAWDLNMQEQIAILGKPSRTTFFAWKRSPTTASLSQIHLERISYLFGIWKALNTLIPDDRQAHAWIKKPNDNPLFGGAPPIAHMLRGHIVDLADVRRLLEARMGG